MRPFRGAYLATAIITAVAGMILVSPPAQAATCSGTGCNGKDPEATGCSAGATVADSVALYPSGRAQLRWSPSCGTNWVRILDFPGGSSSIRITVSSEYGSVPFLAPGTPGSHWGNMVYAPGCARGDVLYVTDSGSHQDVHLESSAC